MTAAAAARARLSLGPVLFNWPAEELRDFYFRIADEAAVDIVYLGEVVCSKRAPFFTPYLPQVVKRLQQAGKEVVHSTLALIMNEGEMDAVRAVAAAPDLLVEANDISCASLLAGRPHVVGPFVNVYNEDTLRVLAGNGAVRVALPVEVPGRAMAGLARAADGVEIEVQVFGRLPLALSARCYHARIHNLHRDGCRYVCGADRNGMDVHTLDDEAFLTVNGTQVLSYTVCNLIREVVALRKAGVGCFRLWPHDLDMAAVAGAFRAVLDDREDAAAAEARLAAMVDFAPFSNGFHYGGVGAGYVTATSPSLPPASGNPRLRSGVARLSGGRRDRPRHRACRRRRGRP